MPFFYDIPNGGCSAARSARGGRGGEADAGHALGLMLFEFL